MLSHPGSSAGCPRPLLLFAPHLRVICCLTNIYIFGMLNWCNKTKQSFSHGALNVIPYGRFGSRPHFNFHLPAVPRKFPLTVLTLKWPGFHQPPPSRSPKPSLTVLAGVAWISSVPAKPLSEIVLNSFNSEVVTDITVRLRLPRPSMVTSANGTLQGHRHDVHDSWCPYFQW